MYTRKKKASLNLSIEAIVILVMAITMLGLGLGFIRDKFGSTGNLIDDVSIKVKEDIQHDLSNTNKKISFPKTEFKLDNGESEVALVGVKNNADKERKIRLEFKYQDKDNANAILTYDVNGGNTQSAAELTYSEVYDRVAAGEVQLVPIKIQAKAGISSGSYIYSLNVYSCQVGSTCTDLYASKQFFVNII